MTLPSGRVLGEGSADRQTLFLCSMTGVWFCSHLKFCWSLVDVLGLAEIHAFSPGWVCSRESDYKASGPHPRLPHTHPLALSPLPGEACSPHQKWKRWSHLALDLVELQAKVNGSYKRSIFRLSVTATKIGQDTVWFHIVIPSPGGWLIFRHFSFISLDLSSAWQQVVPCNFLCWVFIFLSSR